MKTRILLPLLFIALFFSCDKDKEPDINYNVLTEQRILEISDQAKISDEDIATLERLNANVTDNSLKAKYTEMIEGVKIIKDFIAAFDQFRIDPDIIFQDVYAELETMLKPVTDKLPRKAKLQADLETALANYNTEEFEFLEDVLQNGGLARFLANNFDIQPVEGKPNRYLRADIESVDSLAMSFYSFETGTLPQVLRYFRGLKYLSTNALNETVLDFNHMTNLETLIVTNGGEWKELKIDQLQNLKHLELVDIGRRTPLTSSPFGTVLDFTDKYPLLETLILPKKIYEPLAELILPDNQHLKTLQFVSTDLYYRYLPNIKRLVIEGNQASVRGGLSSIILGSAANKEIDEIRLSGAEVGFGSEHQVKIKKLSLSDMAGTALSNFDIGQIDFDEYSVSSSFAFFELNFAQKPDFSSLKLKQAELIRFADNTYGSNTKFSWADISPVFMGKPNPETLKRIDLGGVTNPPTEEYMKGLFPNLENYNH